MDYRSDNPLRRGFQGLIVSLIWRSIYIMSIAQNSKICRITDSTLVVGADIAKKIHVARVSDVRGSELRDWDLSGYDNLSVCQGVVLRC